MRDKHSETSENDNHVRKHDGDECHEANQNQHFVETHDCIHNQRGVTLLELLLSLSVLGMMLPVLAGLLISQTQLWQAETERLEARQQAEVIVRRIEAEVREGKNFSVLANGFAFTNPQGHLIRYQLATGELLIRDDNGQAATVIGAKVSACKFATDSNGLLVRLQLSTAVGQAHVDLDQTWVGRGNLP